MKYTNRRHADALLKMLSRSNPCLMCPAGIALQYEYGFVDFDDYENDYCHVCQDFIQAGPDCPCDDLGAEESIKRTWLALEAKGYLD